MNPAKYDFNLFLNDPETHFLGFEGEHLRFQGFGHFNGKPFTFEAPVEKMLLEIELKPDSDHEIAKINQDAMMPTAKDFRFSIGDIKTDLAEEDATESLKTILRDNCEKAVMEAYDLIWEGDFDNIGKLPLESFLPMLVIKQISSVAKTFKISPDYLDYGFDPEIFYSKERPYFKKKRSMLKEIDSEFSVQDEEEDPYAF